MSLRSALELAAQGFRVFPLAEGSNKPPKGFFGFQQQATTEPEKIRAWWKENPRYNVGVATGQGVLVVDVDVKSGKKGADSLEALEAMGLPLDGYRVKTPSGGVHVFLRTEQPHRQIIDRLEGLPGIDIKCEGNYVVGAGSIRRDFPGVPYEANGRQMPASPDWLDQLLINARPKHVERTEQPLVELDQPHNVANAIAYLVDRAPQAIEGAGGNDTTYKVAGRMRDYGLSEAKAWEVMLDHWNEHKAAPMWEPEDLLSVVQNAYRYATGAWGGEDMSAWMEVVEGIEDKRPADDGEVDTIDGATKPKPPRFLFETTADLRLLPPAKWLVKHWIPENTVGLIYGKWASGKSFVAFDLALHLAYGMQEWHGAELPGEPCKVLVIAREGHQGFVQRIDAFKKHHGIEGDTENLVFMRAPVNFMSDTDFKLLEKTLRERNDGFRLTIIDTVARVIPGVDMSAPETVTAFTERCDRISKATGATTIGVHHQNKNGGMMGSTFFEANSDFVFEMTRDGDTGPLQNGSIRCAKMKDGPDGWSRSIAYSNVQWGDEADPQGSLVVSHISEEVTGRKTDIRDVEAKALVALEDALEEAGEYKQEPHMPVRARVVAYRKWREHCLKRGVIDPEKSSGQQRQQIFKTKNALIAKGLVGEYNGYVWNQEDEK